MHVLADIAVTPVGSGTSLSDHIARCEAIFADAGLKTLIHAQGTNVEGEWEQVVNAMRRCHEALHEEGVARVDMQIRLETRTDCEDSMQRSIDAVREKIAAGAG